MGQIPDFETINPYVRMVRLKREALMTGIWCDIDNVFTYIAGGKADFIINGIHYSLRAGNAIIIPPYTAHMIVARGTETLVQYIIHFDYFETEERKKLVHKDILDEEDRQIVLPDSQNLMKNQVIIAEIPEAQRNKLIQRYLDLNREFQGDLPGRELMLKAGCLECLICTLRNRIDTERKIDNKKSKTKSWIHIENAIDYIQNTKLEGALDNDSIAAAIGVSPNYLTSVFQLHLGMSLHRYVTNIRVECAQQLLLSGKVNVTEAADCTGFSSIHVFSKTFKNILGITPSQFMDEIVNREHIAENKDEIADQMWESIESDTSKENNGR